MNLLSGRSLRIGSTAVLFLHRGRHIHSLLWTETVRGEIASILYANLQTNRESHKIKERYNNFPIFVRVKHIIREYCENVLSKDPVSSVESDKTVLILLATESCLCICETKQKTHLKQLRVNSRKSRYRQARMLDAIRPGAMRQSWMHFRSWCEL